MRKKILVFEFCICLISVVLVILIKEMTYSQRCPDIEEIKRSVAEIERRLSEVERRVYGREGVDEYLRRMKEEAEEKRVAQMHEIFESLEPQKYISQEEFLGKSDSEEKNPFLQ